MPTATNKSSKAKIMRAFRLASRFDGENQTECKNREISISEFIKQAGRRDCLPRSLQGTVSKRLGLRYRSGRSPHLLKIKNQLHLR